MKKIILFTLLFTAPAHAQIYSAPGGIYPICQPVTVCTGGQCETVTVCR